MKPRMLKKIEELTSLILTFYDSHRFAQYHHLVESVFFKKIFTLAEARGLEFTIRYVKTSRLAVTRYLTGHPMSVADQVALDGGWPVWLIPFKELTADPGGVKFLLTLLIALRGIKTTPVLDTKTITDPWKGTDSITEKEFDHACGQLGIKETKVEWKQFHMSTKTGPLGQAMLHSFTELTCLPQQLLDNIRVLGGERLRTVIDGAIADRFGGLSLARMWEKFYPPKTKSFRKLSYFSDKEGKTRVIAILDYWSQTALRPYHKALFAKLRRVKGDCTFDQGAFIPRLANFSPYFSIDLSNATDRLPLALQLRVMERLFGKERAEAWSHVLVGYEYHSKGNPSVSYNCGQPMGAYSSWAALALTHHLIVRVAALRAGIAHFTRYALLGDDLVIADAAVAEQYLALTKELDMPVSEAKTHVSNDTYEFAKRWIHKGTEVTGYSIAGFDSTWRRYPLLYNYLSTQRDHGWVLEDEQVPGLISALYKLYGAPQHWERTSKLYKVFGSLAQARAKGDFSLIPKGIEEAFVLPLSQRTVLLSDGLDLEILGKEILVEAAKRLTERDFGRFQKDAQAINAKLNAMLRRNFPDLSVQDYRKALGRTHPLVLVLNGMILESALLLNRVFGKAIGLTRASDRSYQAIEGKPSDYIVPDDAYLNVGLSKYFVSKGVFTLRTSHSLSLSDSQMTKISLDVSRDFIEGKWLPRRANDVLPEDQRLEVNPWYNAEVKTLAKTIKVFKLPEA